MKYFDAHTHVQFAAYDADRKETIERALKTGVSFINVGTQRDTSARAVELAREFSTFSNSCELEKVSTERHSPFGVGVYASVGLHPIHTEASYHDEDELGPSHSTSSGFTSRGEEFDYDYYKKLALDPKVVAIGECGLDYYRATSDKGQETLEETKKKQKVAFIKQIELAIEINKPLMIHCRDAFDDLIKILKSYFLNHKSFRSPGVVHFYSGTVENTKKLLDLEFSFTFGGVVTFPPRAGKHAGDYDEIIKMIPLDRILSETDAPYVAPVPYRGKRNEPSYVVEVVKKLAEIKGISTERMQQYIWENAKRIFTF